MEKRRRIEAIDGEFLLPEAMIQHIQSFLTGKEAGQTSILSKSWYSAWSTRPNLVFDEPDFGIEFHNRGERDGFWEFAKKTMQRYEELNLKIESFRLRIKSRYSDAVDHYSYSLAKELIVKAMNMGVIDFNFEIEYHNRSFTLPRVVFGSKTLIRLSVTGCKIDLGEDRKVSCSGLESLNLDRVCLEGNAIWDIISSCPLIENFILSESLGIFKVQDSDHVRTIRRSLGSVVNGPINLYKLCKLKSLLLGHVDIDTLFFSNLSSNLPCLKNLTLHYCGGYNYKGIKLCSHSLECISFKQNRLLRANFDVPSIRKFNFSGLRLPSLSFKTPLREWECDISVSCHRTSTKWFLKLKKLLTCLSLAKISVSLTIGSIVEKSVDFQNLPKTAVENLTMHAPSSLCSALLEYLFWSCRPKFITQYWLPKLCRRGKRNTDFVEILCKRLVQGVREDCSMINPNMFGMHDLEEVNVELFEENIAEWRPLPWKTLLDASSSPKIKQKIRFHLRWGPEPITFRGVECFHFPDAFSQPIATAFGCILREWMEWAKDSSTKGNQTLRERMVSGFEYEGMRDQ